MRAQRAVRSPLLSYIAGAAFWYGSVGMQAVLFSWLAVGELGAPAEVVGLVQMAHVLPVLLLLLLGGATADRLERRRLLVSLHAAAAALVATLAVVVASGRLELPLLFAYAVGMGVLTAFLHPARDALLSDVAGGNLTRAATALTLAQYGALAAGTLCAGSARFLGLPVTLSLQAALLVGGMVAMTLLPRSRAGGTRGSRITGAELLVGLREVVHSPTMRWAMLALTGVGLFLAGAYFVVLPVLVRDHYHGGVAQLSLFMGSLQAGTVTGAAFLLWRGVTRRGLGLVASLGAACVPLFVLSLGAPFPAALAAGFVWGLCVAGFQSLGRAIMQESAPEAQRARVLSVFSLALMGAGVLGQPVAGLLAGWLGPLGALGAGALGMLVFVGCVAFLTPVTKIH